MRLIHECVLYTRRYGTKAGPTWARTSDQKKLCKRSRERDAAQAAFYRESSICPTGAIGIGRFPNADGQPVKTCALASRI